MHFMLRVILVLFGGVLVPYTFAMIVSSGIPLWRLFIKGLLLSVPSSLFMLLIAYWASSSPHPIYMIVPAGFALALLNRGLVAFSVIGKNVDEAAWVGFGFGLTESLLILYPSGDVLGGFVLHGGFIYRLYRRSLSSLFQSASAVLFSRLTLLRFIGLLLVQGIGLSLSLSAISNGMVAGNHTIFSLLYGYPVLRAFFEKRS